MLLPELQSFAYVILFSKCIIQITLKNVVLFSIAARGKDKKFGQTMTHYKELCAQTSLAYILEDDSGAGLYRECRLSAEYKDYSFFFFFGDTHDKICE